MADEITSLVVFVASPGDVAKERELALKAIAEVNETLNIMGSRYRFEVRSWEKNASPEAGLPESVITTQLSIERCDIFIGILWKRLGVVVKSK